jgi:hypothetical protein
VKKKSPVPSALPEQDLPGEEPLLEEVCDLDALFRAEYEHGVNEQIKAVEKRGGQLQFPDLNVQTKPRFVTQRQARSSVLFPEAGHSLFPGSILDELQAKSQRVLSENEQQQQEALREQARLDASLRRIFAFLDELTRQLNILKPVISRIYTLARELEFKDLAWQEGRVDYQSMNLHAENAALESVTMTYRLASAESAISLERESDFVAPLQRRLFDYGVLFDVKKVYNDRRILQRAWFTIQPEVKPRVCWRINSADGKLRCETHNLERFGRVTWLLPVEAPMDIRFLDEFGRLVLGQEHDFPYILGKIM